jgi:hypothetical protein
VLTEESVSDENPSLAAALAAALLTGTHQISLAQGANKVGGESDADNNTALSPKTSPDTNTGVKTGAMPKTNSAKTAIPNSVAKDKSMDPAPKSENK